MRVRHAPRYAPARTGNGMNERQHHMDGWVIDQRKTENGTRYELPTETAEKCGNHHYYLTLQPLTYAQTLQRESNGIVEWYYFDGREPSVRRTYDLATMAEYDYKHCIIDFCLPTKDKSGTGTVRMEPDNPAANLAILQKMPPKLAAWVNQCIADVNMRTPDKRQNLEAAKKN